jgi:hypothetical protein
MDFDFYNLKDTNKSEFFIPKSLNTLINLLKVYMNFLIKSGEK